jgi:hypothetical protein
MHDFQGQPGLFISENYSLQFQSLGAVGSTILTKFVRTTRGAERGQYASDELTIVPRQRQTASAERQETQ